MAYNPTVWATGDIITAEKLNKMEGGIAGAGLQLYGPYYVRADSDLTLEAGSAANWELDKPYDYNTYKALDFPADPCICFLAGYNLGGNVLVTHMSAPVYNEGDSEWNGAAINLDNNGAASVTLGASDLKIIFYATAEFPTKQA